MTLNSLRIPLSASLTVCICFLGYWVFQSASFPPHDFANSYFGAWFFLRGEFDISIFDPYTFNKKIFDEGFRNIFLSYSPNPPFTALFFAPFALIPLPAAKLLFNLISCALFLLSVYRLSKHYEVSSSLLFLVIPVLFFLPLRNQILFGQTYFLLFFLLGEGYLAYENKHYKRSALYWGLAIMLKVFPTIIVLFLILKKEWRATAYLAIACLLLLVVCLFFQDVTLWKDYFLTILQRSNKGEISSSFTTNYQSALMLFKYLFVEHEATNPRPVFTHSPVLFVASLVLFKSAVLGACSSVIVQRKDFLAFGFLLLGSTLISPYGSTYSNILLLLVLIPLLKELPLKQSLAIVILIFFISNVPITIFHAFPVVLQFPRLALLSALFIAIFYFSKPNIKWIYFPAFLLLLSIPLLFAPASQRDPSHLFLKTENHNLIYDYGLKDGSIFYKYWDDHGENIFITDEHANEAIHENITIKDNQLWYQGKQITTSDDNKLKPALIDNRYILYLSDKDKGMGFYALRIISLTPQQ